MPSLLLPDVDERIREAVRAFWTGRKTQTQRQAEGGRIRDAGTRSSVTGGGHLDAFRDLVKDQLRHVGLNDASIRGGRTDVALPGYYRPSKRWDLLVIHNDKLVAAVELKSQVGSVGNNYNNRIEEALGTSMDAVTAHREGLLSAGPMPWLGWAMIFDPTTAGEAVRRGALNFPLDPVFDEASYSKRYEVFVKRLMQERVYNFASVVLTQPTDGPRGVYRDLVADASFKQFLASLAGHVAGVLEGSAARPRPRPRR